MVASTSFSTQDSSSRLSQQLVMQRAQRNADQAEANARAIAAQAVSAQREADRAQANASSLRSASSNAEASANLAQLNVSSIKANATSDQQMDTFYQRVSAAQAAQPATGTGTTAAVAATTAVVTVSAAPTTGTQVDTVA